MRSEKYRASYLPLFYKDLDEKITYIAEKLKNPKAASDLLDKVEACGEHGKHGKPLIQGGFLKQRFPC